jgi:hypothetical protein
MAPKRNFGENKCFPLILFAIISSSSLLTARSKTPGAEHKNILRYSQ